MSFTVGETVGLYKIVSYIGQGGMATIFRAHQTNLDRDVALKIIHPALKEDKSFVVRLKREATVIAKLSHPNIVAVHDLAEHEGLPFLVLQFIDGQTLKDVLATQKLSTAQILNIARPVADALMYAHAHGVLHRDVKPSNILIDTEGHVYLTDFGLARIAQSGESTSSQDMLIGSPHYLSPEQARSEAVDARTDIYSLGIILFEMFAGKVPFSGETPYATILAQINEAPPTPRSINPKIPPAVEQVILKAIAKDPKDRYGSMREMMRALENAVRGPRDADEPAAPIPLLEYKPSSERVLLAPLALVGDQLKTAKTTLSDNSNKRRPLVLAGLGLGALIMLLLCVGVGYLGYRMLPSIFPPARGTPTVMFGIVDAQPTQTFSSVTVAPPPLIVPLLSPTRPAAAATRVVDTPRGKIAYTVATGDAAEQHMIWIADADGTDAKPVIEAGLWPSLSPDGTKIAYYRMKDTGIYVANIDGGNAHRLVATETCCVQWSPDSKRLVYLQGKLKAGDTKIFIMNADGSSATEITPGFNPAWAPDGNRLAYAACQPNSTECGLYIYDLKTHAATMITRDNGGAPQWSPRSDRIVYHADSGKGATNVFAIKSDGSGRTQLTSGKSNDGQPAWTVDGSHILWRSDQDGKGWAIFAMRADGSNPRLIIKNAPPDGDRWARESLSCGP
jgi:tRNA A-37 threonylcarbamoyl transferase component Bud32